jgi:hypothetical protein
MFIFLKILFNDYNSIMNINYFQKFIAELYMHQIPIHSI